MRYLVIAALFVFSLSFPAYAELHIQDLGGDGVVEDSDGNIVGQYMLSEGEHGAIHHDEYGVGYLTSDGSSGTVEFTNGVTESYVKHDVSAESADNK